MDIKQFKKGDGELYVVPIAMSAPVIESMLAGEYETIHSTLTLEPVLDDNGDVEFFQQVVTPIPNPAVRLELFKDEDSKWRWRAIAGNERNIGSSGEGFENHLDAFDIASRMFPGVWIDDPVEAPGE